jgi:hypothetical protein
MQWHQQHTSDEDPWTLISAAGFTIRQEPEDMFWGDRMGRITDPYGNGFAVLLLFMILSSADELLTERTRRPSSCNQ